MRVRQRSRRGPGRRPFVGAAPAADRVPGAAGRGDPPLPAPAAGRRGAGRAGHGARCPTARRRSAPAAPGGSAVSSRRGREPPARALRGHADARPARRAPPASRGSRPRRATPPSTLLAPGAGRSSSPSTLPLPHRAARRARTAARSSSRGSATAACRSPIEADAARRATTPARAEARAPVAGAARRDAPTTACGWSTNPSEAGRTTATLLASLAAGSATLHMISGADGGRLAGGRLRALGREVSATRRGRAAAAGARAGPAPARTEHAIWQALRHRRVGIRPLRPLRCWTSSATTSRSLLADDLEDDARAAADPARAGRHARDRGRRRRRRSSTSRSGYWAFRREVVRGRRGDGGADDGRRPPSRVGEHAAAERGRDRCCGDRRSTACAPPSPLDPTRPRLQGLAAPRTCSTTLRRRRARQRLAPRRRPATRARARSAPRSCTCPDEGWVGQHRGAGPATTPRSAEQRRARAASRSPSIGGRGAVLASARLPATASSST